jgi:uncharacterized membrane protein YdbT with pleckstrin-like domain
VAFPDDVLDDDEEVVADLRPHWRRVAPALALVPVLVAVTSYLEFVVPGGEVGKVLRIVVAVLAVAALLRWCLLPWVRWASTRYVLTSSRVMVRRGWLARSGRDVSLGRISDVSYSHTVAERLFGSGTLIVESAGENGQLVLADVPRVSAVQRQLYRLVEDATYR